MSVYTGDTIALQLSDGASPEVYTEIAQVEGYTPPSQSVNFITNYFLGSALPVKTPSSFNLNQATFEVVIDPDDTQYTALEANKIAKTLTSFKLVVTGPTAGTLAFSGYVMDVSLSGGGEDPLTGSVSVEITSVTPWAA